MKKIAFLFILAATVLGISAFNLEKSNSSSLKIYYESSPGIFTEIPPTVTPCPQGSSDQCVIEINGEDEPLWLDQGVNAYKKN